MSDKGQWKFGDSDDMIKRHFEEHAEAYAKELGRELTSDVRAKFIAGYMKSLDLVLAYADTARAHVATLTKLYNKERARADAADADIKAIYAAQNG